MFPSRPRATATSLPTSTPVQGSRRVKRYPFTSISDACTSSSREISAKISCPCARPDVDETRRTARARERDLAGGDLALYRDVDRFRSCPTSGRRRAKYRGFHRGLPRLSAADSAGRVRQII